MNRESTRVMVTGANGHVGYNVVKNLHEHGYQVRASVRDSSDPKKTAKLTALGIKDIVSLDITDSNTFSDVSKDIDILFHVAATYRIHTGGANADQEMINDSIEGVTAAMQAVIQNNIGKIVLTSSIVTLPTRAATEPPATESDWRTDLQVPYFRAKVEAEKIAWNLAEKHNINLVTVLPGAVLGPDFGAGTQSTDFIKAISMGSMRLGTIDNVLPVIDVRDVAEVHRLAAENDTAGRYIVSPDQHPTFTEVIKTMKQIDPSVPNAMMIMPSFTLPTLPLFDWAMHKMVGIPRTLTSEFMKSLGTTRMITSNATTKSVLGWTQAYSLQDTLSATMEELK